MQAPIQNTKMRRLLIRTASATVYLAVVLAGLLLGKFFFLAFILLVTLLMMNEFQHMALGRKYALQQIITILTGLSIPLSSFGIAACGWQPGILACVFIGIFTLCSSLIFIKDRSQISDIFALFSSILYIAVPMSVFNLGIYRTGEYSGILILSMFCIVAMSDVGAYALGMSIGQKHGRKLCPGISPKKTWTGVWGGLAFAIGTALGLHFIGWLPYSVWHCVILSVIITVSGIFGDLIESVWKRHYNLKDSGNIIPGHGGMMDRFDSTLLAVPMGILYIIIFNIS